MTYSYPCSWCDANAEVGNVGFQKWDLCMACYREFDFVRRANYEEIRKYFRALKEDKNEHVN